MYLMKIMFLFFYKSCNIWLIRLIFSHFQSVNAGQARIQTLRINRALSFCWKWQSKMSKATRTARHAALSAPPAAPRPTSKCKRAVKRNIVLLRQEAKGKERNVRFPVFGPVGELKRAGSRSICAVNNSVNAARLVRCEQTGVPVGQRLPLPPHHVTKR